MALGGSPGQDHTMISYLPVPHCHRISGSIFSTVFQSLSFFFSFISPHAFHLSCPPIIHLSIIVSPVANDWVSFFQLPRVTVARTGTWVFFFWPSLAVVVFIFFSFSFWSESRAGPGV